MERRFTAVFSFALLVFSLPSWVLGTNFDVDVTTERPDAVYSVGEEVRFLVKVTKDGAPVSSGTVDYILFEDGLTRVLAGSVPLGESPAVILGRLDSPGVLQCEVVCQPEGGDKITQLAAAAVSPFEIGPSLPAPGDFDAFWAAQKDRLAQVPMKASMAPVKVDNPAIECFDVQVDCVDGVPVSGYFGRPKGAAAKSLPIVLWVQGAGVRGGALGHAVGGAEDGFLSMDINAHGIENGKPVEFYSGLNEGELAGYPFFGREKRETSYFVGMYLRLVRALDFLCSQPEWNGKIVAVCGHSQGGGQALAAGGLDERVTMIAAGVPAMCDHTGRAIGRINGWPKLVPEDAGGHPDPAILEASRYVDAVNFAPRCKAEAIMSIGFIDRTCPPTGNFAAYNTLPGKKRLITKPLMGHSAPPEIHAEFREAILEHARGKKE